MPDVVVANHVTDAHTILRLLAYGVLVVGPDWRVLYANPEADRIFGTHGMTLWDRCPDLAHTGFASGLRYAMADRTELLSESALPSVGWCQARARPMPDGGLLISIRPVHAHTIETPEARHALLIGEIGEALTREESLRAALGRCASAIVRQLDVAGARIWVVDGTWLDLFGAAGGEAAELPRLAIGDDHPIGRIARTGEPSLDHDAVSFAGYPLRIEGRIVGVLALYARRPLDHELTSRLSSIVDALALGIDRKTSEVARRAAEARVREQARDLATLLALGQELTSELDSEALAQRVIDAATTLANAQVGVFFYNTPSEFMLYAVAGVAKIAFDSVAVPRSTPLLAATFIERKSIRIDDLAASPLFGQAAPHHGLSPGHPPMASYLAVPVTGREGRRIGALLFGHERPGAFTEATQQLVEGVAAQAAIAMDNARMFGEALALIAALEKSNRELDQFAYVASHDLKAPLRGIANLAQWIEDDLAGKLDDSTRDHLHLLRGRVTRLENLIAGILAYSRAGRERGKVERVDVGTLARECWELLAPPATARLVARDDLPTLFAPRSQVEQVLMNLIGNAVKYNPQRELVVEVGVSRREGRFYELYVRDDGVGIAPEFHDKIWGLFQTLERRDKLESTGIGLSIVRKIVESRGGSTRVESRPGAGATFFFTWPSDNARSADER